MRRTLIVITAIIGSLLSPTFAADSFAPMLEKVIPAVVNIKAEGKLPPTIYIDKSKKDKSKEQDNDDLPKPISKHFTSLGSGVIIDSKQGYIITNEHVIKDADRLTVTLMNGQQYTAKLIGADEPSDIAVLQISAPKLSALVIANSNEVKVGDKIVAIGNPFGLGQSVTSGIVSAMQRTNLQLEGYENFIQIDAPINFGNSGGALVNTKGELIGINTAMLSPDGGNIGIGFSIPSNMVKNVEQQLIKYGKVERGVMGVMVQTLTPPLADALGVNNIKGAIITHVTPNSPGSQAGLKAGDIITQVNDLKVSTSSQVVNTVGFLRKNTEVSVTVNRNGKVMTLTPTIIDANKQIDNQRKAHPFTYGLQFDNFHEYSALHGHVTGIIIVGVLKDSNAWSAGLRSGDVITSIDKKPISNIDDLNDTINTSADSIVLNTIRDDSSVYVIIHKDDGSAMKPNEEDNRNSTN